ACGLLILASLSAAYSQGNGSGQWSFGGGDIANTRNAPTENKISPSNAARLQLKWSLLTHGDVSATPTVESAGDVTNVYAVDWGGWVYSVDGATGAVRWSHPLSDYTGNPHGSISRTSPAIAGNLIVLGDQGDVNISGFTGFAATASVMGI